MALPTNPPLPAINYGSGVPTEGYWAQGQIIINVQAEAGDAIGWVCTAAGTPGSWVALGFAQPTTLTTVSSSGSTLASGSRYNLLTSTTASSYTLPAAGSQGAGTVLTVLNAGGASAVTLAAPSGNTIVGGPVLTTVANARLSVLSDGNTTWYNVS
jgi:hypothetical protein